MAANKKFTRKELSTRNTTADCVTIIDNKVYDVTKFLDDHPGGHEVLLQVGGRDGSEDFDDVGHSLDAKELMKKYLIGELVDEDKVEVKRKNFAWDKDVATADKTADPGFFNSWKFPVAFGLLLTILYSYFLN